MFVQVIFFKVTVGVFANKPLDGPKGFISEELEAYHAMASPRGICSGDDQNCYS